MAVTIQECLDTIGVKPKHFHGCNTLEEEFSKIKKKYHKVILSVHPDKGGDASVFRRVRTAFEAIKKQYEKAYLESFATDGDCDAFYYEKVATNYSSRATPSWEYYNEAARDTVPTYRIEEAKSNRSKCRQVGEAKMCGVDCFINKGEVRIGLLNGNAGNYGRWQHLECWRVPSSIHRGLPNPDKYKHHPKLFMVALEQMNSVVLSGFSELDEDSQDEVIAYVMNKHNWARTQVSKPKEDSVQLKASRLQEILKPPATTITTKTASTALKVSSYKSQTTRKTKEPKASRAVVSSTKKNSNEFAIPIPGRDGAPANSMKGKRFVLTGIFPEVGGGCGLDLGKARVKRMIENFGGRVTSAVSGLTNVVVAGKEPGAGKISQARQRGIQIISLSDLKKTLQGRQALEDAANVVVTKFSDGYNGNGIANRLTAEERQALATGTGYLGGETSNACYHRRQHYGYSYHSKY